MGRDLQQMAMFLEVAEDLYKEGSLSKPDYLRLINRVEESYKNPKTFTAELVKWAMGLLQLDDVENHIKNFDVMVDSFLESPDADDHARRTEVLQLVKQLKQLFISIRQYEQKKLILKYVADE